MTSGGVMLRNGTWDPLLCASYGSAGKEVAFTTFFLWWNMLIVHVHIWKIIKIIIRYGNRKILSFEFV